ncbi:MAG: hypothetical protein JSW41_02995 [Candidatus Aenigmatarchaeota archaeon]|nr:MAG: hypothetical protein JSW41_02995 [Candidatus Aenigmarchaeota archaeon]
MKEIKCYTCPDNTKNKGEYAHYCDALRLLFHVDEEIREKEMRYYQRFCDRYRFSEE